MKKIYQFTSAIFLFISCNVVYVEPDPTQVYYNFINLEGKDFFENNSNYSIDDLTAYREDGFELGLIMDVVQNKIHYFRTSPWIESPIYFDYGNGDIDTLIKEFEPGNIKPFYDFENLDRVRFYLNGKLITDWNFTVDPQLKDSIEKYNFPIIRPGTPFPVPVIIQK